eukprot:TRINITY_DN2764_c0_g1_i1.p1 TRINITY_DN2764_c0_g1~~TRINITY_DN2764_c0_g1_i1.p1  ORF type:complete len:394 (-),score=63.31 TRINITY_DN2764_c0_g1_i1:74-1108(-)
MCLKNTDPVSSKIDKQIAADRREKAREIKLLLLGTGESGKSTIAKQLRIIHDNGFSHGDREISTPIVLNNVVTSAKVLQNHSHALPLSDKGREAGVVLAQSDYFSGSLSPDLISAIKTFWAEPSIKNLFLRAGEINLPDSAAYFLDSLDRLTSPGYLPNDQDMIRCRSRTTGVRETTFELDQHKFRIMDVGGQRSERRKWAGCFSDVTAVIFCVAMSEYDMTLVEDESINRMHESLKVFKDICNSGAFADIPIIIFLNKKDIFEEKIMRVDMKGCFPEYNGGANIEAAAEYIKNQFLLLNQTKKLIYTHRTCATDTGNVSVVFNAVKDIVMTQALQEMGLMSTM